MNRRQWVSSLVLAGLAVPLQAQEPRPLTLVVPAPAGAGLDALTRMLAQHLGQQTGEVVIVENRPGAGNSIGTEHVARAAPDGKTVLIASATSLATLDLQLPLAYIPVRDLRPVIQLASTHLVLAVRADSPVRTPADLERLARSRPGGLNCGAPPGMMLLGAQQLAAAMPCQLIPYPGVAPALTALLGGHLDLLLLEPESVSRPHVEAGRLRYVAVSDGLAGSPHVRGVPGFRTAWPGFIGQSAMGAFVPQATPPAIVMQLNQRFNQVLASNEVRDWMNNASQPTAGGSPEAMAQLVRKTREEHTELLARLGLLRR